MTPASRWLLMLLPFVLWGTAMAAMKPLLAGAGPLSVAWLRLLPAGLAVLLAAVVMGRSLRVAPADRLWLLAFALIDGSLFQGLLTRGLGNTGAGLGSVLIDSQPLLVALLARSLFGEAINPVGWVGLLVGLAGIVCLGLPAPLLQHLWLEGPSTLGVEAWSHGELWMLGAAVAMAVGTVLCRFAMAHSDPVAITGWHMLIGSFPLLGGSAMATVLDPGAAPFWPAWSRIDWGLMTYASLLGSALAYGLFFWFARQGDLTGFTALTFLTPVFALLCGVLLLDERLFPLQWLGAGLALGAVVLINQRQRLWEGPKVAEASP
ncbi:MULTISPECIES: DMT family transporter [Synechococcaceae]|uniref:DMT family transporter n=1 Tax=Synechococcaceae TaxID=1890426 RepID=UPI00223B6256|nr:MULTISPECIES: DMT family transporter [Synechococcaceae]MCT0202633.1 DMT family transporter [Synechococcus sp. CS-603]MCT4365567.1 DMT family transporter [Candidatus Regnicoccus frigidus MAG-AL1]MCT4368685.1 DMT family transporter [Candidatus Regnicoccus frigidus MAG-AL2]